MGKAVLIRAEAGERVAEQPPMLRGPESDPASKSSTSHAMKSWMGSPDVWRTTAAADGANRFSGQ